MKAKFSGQRLFRWGLLGSIFLGAFLGCSDPSESSTGLVFRYNEPTSLSSLDPAFARDQGHTWVAKQLFSTLVDTDSALEIQPNLALSWSSDASGMHWEFKLRRGVYFHDDACFPGGKGRQLWAQDVVYSLQRLLDPQTASPGAWVLENVAKVSVLDSFTLAIDLKAFDPALLGRLAMPYCGIVPVEALEAYGSGFSEHPVGSGPFRFQAWARQEKLVLRRHPSYYEFDAQGQRLPYLEAVAIRFIPDRQAAFLEFLKGELDLVSGVDPSYKDQLFDAQGGLKARWAGELTLQKSPFLNTEFIGIRAQQPDPDYLGDVRIRQALNWALDRASMMRYLKNNIGIPAYGALLPAGLAGHRSPEDWRHEGFEPWSFDLERAQALVRETGVLERADLAPIVLSTTASYRDICEYVQSAWTKLGFPVQVNVMPSAAFREDKSAGRLSVYRASWIADYPDASNYLMLFESAYAAPNGPNAAQVRDADYDALALTARQAVAADERAAAARAADAWLKREVPLVPLFYDESVRVFRQEWQGLPSHPMNVLDLRRVTRRSVR